jgi:hypothetical protein
MSMTLSRQLATLVAGSRNSQEVHQSVFCAMVASTNCGGEYKELLLDEVCGLLRERLRGEFDIERRFTLTSNIATLGGCRRAC